MSVPSYSDEIESAASERERLILQHLPQVHLIARRIHGGLPDHVILDDLVSTGILGLIAAVDNFDPSQHTQLRTYAEHRIRGAILDSLRDLDWAPREARRRARQIQEAIAAAQQRLQREPRDEEIAAELQLTLEEYHRWLTQVQGINLHELDSAGPNGEPGLLQVISDDEERTPSRLLERSELERLLASAIAVMPEPERMVLSLYYEQELNLKEIGEIMNLHFSRVSQLKAQAILRLRSCLERHWNLPPRPARPARSSPVLRPMLPPRLPLAGATRG